MNIARFDPFREFEDILRRYSEPVGRNLLGRDQEGILSTGWTPSVDINETKDAYVVKGELPGVDKDNVDISIEDNLLVIRGEKKVESDSDDDKYHRKECVYGSFERSFSLPKQVDVNKVEASFNNGVLKLNIPKAEEAKPKQIQVQIN